MSFHQNNLLARRVRRKIIDIIHLINYNQIMMHLNTPRELQINVGIMCNFGGRGEEAGLFSIAVFSNRNQLGTYPALHIITHG